MVVGEHFGKFGESGAIHYPNLYHKTVGRLHDE